mmetsp:Transcript_1763/g.3522  ORF Transcript_1763/g.3522 Transcript_1763/m.3522 type:complete len:187 (+) Transcript_1763:189-749(+)
MNGVRDEDYCYYMGHLCWTDRRDSMRYVPKWPEFGVSSGQLCECARCGVREHEKCGWKNKGLRAPHLTFTTCRGGQQVDPKRDVSDWSDPSKLQFTHVVFDELGRLVRFTPCPGCTTDCGTWRQKNNGTRSWMAEGFDSQYVADTLPNGAATLDLWPGCHARMVGDEFVIKDGTRVTYLSCEYIRP